MKALLYFSIFQAICVSVITLTVIAVGIPWTGEKFTDLSPNLILNLILGTAIPLYYIWLLVKKRYLTNDQKWTILFISLGYMLHSTINGYVTGLFAIPMAFWAYHFLRQD